MSFRHINEKRSIAKRQRDEAVMQAWQREWSRLPREEREKILSEKEKEYTEKQKTNK